MACRLVLFIILTYTPSVHCLKGSFKQQLAEGDALTLRGPSASLAGESLQQNSTYLYSTHTLSQRGTEIEVDPLADASNRRWIQMISSCFCVLFVALMCGHEGFLHFTGKMSHLRYSSDLGSEHRAIHRSESELNDTRIGRQKIQWGYLLWTGLLVMDSSVLIPTSYELSQEMQCSAAVSGILIGSGYFANGMGGLAGAFVFKQFSMTVVRNMAMIGTFIIMAVNIGIALTLESKTDHGPDTMWVLIGLRFLGGVGKIGYVCQYVAYNVTPKPDRTRLSILTAAATNSGLCLGPFLSALVIHILGGREAVPSVYLRTSTSLWVMAALYAGLGIVFAVSLPLDLKPYTPEDNRPAPDSPLSPMIVTVEGRKSIVKQGIIFSAQRSLTVAGIEAGTAMILETQFKWGTRAIGFSISLVFGSTVVFCLIMMTLCARRLMKDVCSLLAMTLISALGTVLLFDFHTGYASQVLIADVLIYPFMYCANGIADGIVTAVAVPDTWFSLECYLAFKSITINFCRFISFPIARFLLETKGRNIYAGAQLLLGVLGIGSAFTIASKLHFEDQHRFRLVHN